MKNNNPIKSLAARPIMRNLLFIVLVFSLGGCLEKPSPAPFMGETMGTQYSINVLGDERANQAQIEKRLLQINAVFSTWLSDSELSRLNDASVGEKIAVSSELYDLLEASAELYQQSDGYFDPGIGRLIDLWGFGAKGGRIKPPIRAEIEQAFLQSSIKHLVLSDGLVEKTKAIQINLSAIAKGYAVDEVARLLRADGINDFLLEIGGEVFASGTKNGEPWMVGVEHPNNEEPIAIPLKDRAIATSGNYRNFFIWEGEKYMHIFDPKTGLPANNDLASVSVIHPRSALADAYATAMMAMGSVRAIEFANQHKIATLLIRIEGDNYQIIKINLP